MRAMAVVQPPRRPSNGGRGIVSSVGFAIAASALDLTGYKYSTIIFISSQHTCSIPLLDIILRYSIYY